MHPRTHPDPGDSLAPPPLLRVLHVMTRMATAGTERQLVGMLRAAHGRHWDAHLCVLYPGYPLAEEAAEFMPVTQLPYVRGTDPRRPAALRSLARDTAAQVVHPSLWGASWLTRASLAGTRRPAIVMSERRVEDFRPSWTRLVDAALRPLTDGWIGNSDDVVEFIRRVHGAPRGRVACIGNGIDTAVYHRARAPRPAGGPRIGGVGRLVPEKGWDVAVAALPMVLSSFPDAILRIAGEGPELDALSAAGAGLPLELVGLLPTPHAVAEFMRGLDVFVLPSRCEGMPNVVLEAQACGVPVVVTEAPGMASALGPAATVVPPGDPTALAAAISATLRGGRHPAQVVAQSFDDVARAHLRVFEAALARREGAR
ncbi:MAG: glycosyltransferase family 4 protein [Actinomycetia bacterium]|nr:glycosyltransferase family 4 protein [Actinomycetes bacterium]